MKKTTKSSGARLKSGAVTTKNKSKSSCISEIVALEKKESLPDKEVILKINKFIDALNKALKQQKIDAEASMGGSVAKGTFIKNSFDADIFVKFHPKFRGQNISDILDSVLKKMKLEANRVHGSRDYFQIKKEFTYELVPVLNVNDYRQAENVADMSPLHVLYFIKQSRKIKNLREEIRVTKLFMKSARVYGAESYIKGFSGHVVDLLLIKYKTFLDLVKAAAKWKDELVIDIEKYHIDPRMSLNTSKISGPLIIVDPIQKNRNAAAAVSRECFNLFRQRCRDFLKSPSKDFFEIPLFSDIIDEKIAKTKNAEIFLINIHPLDGKRDVIGSKVLKIKETLEQDAKNKEFELTWSDWEFNDKNSRICLAFRNKHLPETILIKGPPPEMKESNENFKKAHKKTFVKNGQIFAEEKREFKTPLELLKSILSSKYVKEKCQSYSIVCLEQAH